MRTGLFIRPLGCLPARRGPFGKHFEKLDQPALVIAYGVAGLCILLAFLWKARQRRLIFGAFVLTLVFLNVYVGAPTLERILAFVTCALVIGIIASLLGFTSIAGASFTIAKVIAAIFLVLFVVLILIAWGIGAALF